MFPEDMDSQTEDSSLHGGRIRSFKHERGNWATYVYLPCEANILYFPCFFSTSYLLLSYNWVPFVLIHLILSQLNFLCFCVSLFCTSDHPEEEFLELLEELLSVAKARGVVMSPQEEFHLSLSQTVVLRHHWIQPFTQSLKKGLLHCRRFALTLNSHVLQEWLSPSPPHLIFLSKSPANS